MTLTIQLIMLALFTGVLFPLIKKESHAMAQVFALAVAVVCLTLFFYEIEPVLAWAQNIAQATNIDAFTALLKATGIIICTDYARDLCKDAGSESLAGCISLAGRFLVIATAMPLLEMVYTTILELTA